MIGVAAGVIVLCAGILTPVFDAAREKVRRSYCFNNLSQLGLAIRLYSGDFGQRFPTDASWTTVGSMALLTNNYMTAYKTWTCPSDTGVRPANSHSPWSESNLSYAYNAFGLTEQVEPDTPVFADRTSGDIRSTTPYDGNKWTHKSDGGNVNFADGHSEFRRILAPPLYRGKNP